MQQQGTILDAVGRAKHTLGHAHGPDSAIVTVHGTCPVATCRQLNIVEVRADTGSITCSACGQTFDV